MRYLDHELPKPHLYDIEQSDISSSIQKAQLEQNILWLEGELTTDVAHQFCKQLIYICKNNREKQPIIIFIDSPSGSMEAGMQLYSMIANCPYETITIAINRCYSAALLPFLGGDKRGCSVFTDFMAYIPDIQRVKDKYEKDGYSASQIESATKSAINHIKTIRNIIKLSTNNQYDAGFSGGEFITCEEAYDYNIINLNQEDADKIIYGYE